MRELLGEDVGADRILRRRRGLPVLQAGHVAGMAQVAVAVGGQEAQERPGLVLVLRGGGDRHRIVVEEGVLVVRVLLRDRSDHVVLLDVVAEERRRPDAGHHHRLAPVGEVLKRVDRVDGGVVRPANAVGHHPLPGVGEGGDAFRRVDRRLAGIVEHLAAVLVEDRPVLHRVPEAVEAPDPVEAEPLEVAARILLLDLLGQGEEVVPGLRPVGLVGDVDADLGEMRLVHEQREGIQLFRQAVELAVLDQAVERARRIERLHVVERGHAHGLVVGLGENALGDELRIEVVEHVDEVRRLARGDGGGELHLVVAMRVGLELEADVRVGLRIFGGLLLDEVLRRRIGVMPDRQRHRLRESRKRQQRGQRGSGRSQSHSHAFLLCFAGRNAREISTPCSAAGVFVLVVAAHRVPNENQRQADRLIPPPSRGREFRCRRHSVPNYTHIRTT